MPATYEDLLRTPEKAEIINGEIVCLMPAGEKPGLAGGEIFVSLRGHAKRTGRGRAFPDNVGFRVNLPHRKSFAPDAAYHIGPSAGMRFPEGAPIFAAEVRSENDYGEQAEVAMAAKREDYFAAGSQAVWDVDLEGEEVIRKYTVEQPDTPVVFRRGEIADAEPAVPGWTMPVDDLFE